LSGQTDDSGRKGVNWGHFIGDNAAIAPIFH
jgi:hypothetical protein